MYASVARRFAAEVVIGGLLTSNTCFVEVNDCWTMQSFRLWQVSYLFLDVLICLSTTRCSVAMLCSSHACSACGNVVAFGLNERVVEWSKFLVWEGWRDKTGWSSLVFSELCNLEFYVYVNDCMNMSYSIWFSATYCCSRAILLWLKRPTCAFNFQRDGVVAICFTPNETHSSLKTLLINWAWLWVKMCSGISSVKAWRPWKAMQYAKHSSYILVRLLFILWSDPSLPIHTGFSATFPKVFPKCESQWIPMNHFSEIVLGGAVVSWTVYFGCIQDDFSK